MDPERQRRETADYVKASGVIWIILEVIQLCSIVGCVGA